MNEIINTISESFLRAEAWLAAQAAWATIFAWLAIIVAYLFKGALVLRMRKQLRNYDELFAKAEKTQKTYEESLKKSAQQLAESRRQINDEKKLKGHYKNLCDNLQKELKAA